jgi:hypothetical protein
MERRPAFLPPFAMEGYDVVIDCTSIYPRMKRPRGLLAHVMANPLC